MAVLTCFECSSESIEWVGHRELVRCKSCGHIWTPRDSGYDNVSESIEIPREFLPEKANVFASHLLSRFGRVSK